MGPKAGGCHSRPMPQLELKDAGGLLGSYRGLVRPMAGKGSGPVLAPLCGLQEPLPLSGPWLCYGDAKSCPLLSASAPETIPGVRRGLLLGPSLLPSRLPVAEGAAASTTLSLNSSSAWKLVFSHSMVTLPPSSMVIEPYRIPETWSPAQSWHRVPTQQR